ncbi:multidrug transporter MatE (plasmid) [Burkholderia sp. FERM BP-3421]|jgi:putative MATE family efflux protein|uniref:MATE family efflux transporter n=1 Tax=Burkholderia sp. FERM BP-3421 TaxID=1494466 RepID=UPI002362FF6A|nr:MATE family efflux transporter [Burkholderia sp. FERM BP-3421]WDD90553.1 multidrug transporter MatE [Burkholderia sp. FERM BP-3421]
MSFFDNDHGHALLKRYAALAVPTILSGWVYTIYTLIDGVFIGRYVGPQALAALNLILPLLYVPYAFSVMMGVGGATLIARLLGEGREQAARQAFSQVLWSMLAFSVVMSVLVLTFGREIAAALGAHGELAGQVNAYLSRYAWFILFANCLYAMEMFLRVEGAAAARFGLYAMIAGAFVNTALDYWFIVMRGDGMAGAALATGLSMMVSSLVMLGYHLFLATRVVPAWRPFADGVSYIGRMLYNGSSEFLGAVAPAVTVFAFNRVILANFGENGLAAYAILEYLTLGAMVTMGALVQAMQPMISFYRGAADARAVRGAFRIGAIASLAFAAVVAVVMATLSKPLTFLFLPAGGDAWSILEHAVIWYAMAFLPAAGNLIVSGYLTAIEAPGPSAVIATLRSWVLLLGVLLLLNTWLGGTAIWYTLLITEAVTLVASIGLYARRRA